MILKILKRIWGMNSQAPSAKLVNFSKLATKMNPRKGLGLTPTETKANWHAIAVVLDKLKISVKETGLDMAGVQEGKFKACWGFLVMLYFLHSLSQCLEFSVDFAHPIDEKLAAFLQSDDSITVVELGGYQVREKMNMEAKENDSTRESTASTMVEANSKSTPTQQTPPPLFEQPGLVAHRSPARSSKQRREEKERETETAKLRLEVGYLQRQVAFLKEEKRFIEDKHQIQLQEVENSHKSQLNSEKASHAAALSQHGLDLEKEKANMQRGLSEQLKIVEDSLRNEEDAIVTKKALTSMEGHEMEAEILSLRQISTVQKARIAQLESSNARQSKIVSDLQQRLAERLRRAQHWREASKQGARGHERPPNKSKRTNKY